ncbi:MAG: cytochrome D1 domain-containing protein [Burkholderiales bacterium]
MLRTFSSWSCGLLVALFAVATAAAAAPPGPKVYVGNFKDNTVSVVDPANGAAVATVPVVAGPHGMAVSTDGRTVYVSGDASSGVSVIDTATDRVTHTIEVGKAPHGVTLTPDGRWLLVGVYGDDRVAIIDTASRQVVATVPVGKPHNIAVRPDGKLAYVGSQEPGKFALAVVDLATRAVVRSIPLERAPRGVDSAHDGKALYVTLAGASAVYVVDPATDRITAEIPTGVSPHLAQYNRGAPAGVAVVQGPGELFLFDPAKNIALRSIAVGKQPHWVAASGDGRQAYVTNEGSNDLTVVDLATGRTTTIPVGNAPRKVVAQPAPVKAAGGAAVSIVNFAFAPLQIAIAAGRSVTWTNDDGAPHGLGFKDGARGADVLLPGAAFSRVFEQPGTYDYVCSVHPYMTGKVTVRAR